MVAIERENPSLKGVAIPYTGIIRMRPQDERLYAPFIRYLLEGPDFQQQAEMFGVGSVIRHFGPMHLRQMTVQLPPLGEQCAFAQIPGTVDDKMELNRGMNETLEAIARAGFGGVVVLRRLRSMPPSAFKRCDYAGRRGTS